MGSPFEDPEIQAMRASMRPAGAGVRWPRVLTGVLVVACVTFALAYHLPLRSAHQTLTARFTEIQSKVDTEKRAAQDAQARVKELTDKNEALQRQAEEIARRAEASAEASRTLKAALEPKLQKPMAANQAAVALAAGQPVVSLALAHLLAPGKVELGPAGKTTLCAVATASSNHHIQVLAIAGKKDIPATLAAKLKTPLEYNLAVAQLVTKTLSDQCKVAPAKLTASGVPAEPAAPPKLEGKKLSGARVELWLGSAQ